MNNIFDTYDRIRNSDSLDAAQIEKAALHYLCSPCQSLEACVYGVGTLITQWILSHVTFHEGKAYLHSDQYGDVRIKVFPNENDRDEPSILKYLSSCYEYGYAPVLDTAATGGTPLWDDWTNNIFRAVHDSHHWKYQLGEDVVSEVTIGHKSSECCFNWLVSQGHDRQRANLARKALFFEVAGQAAAATWLGGYDAKRRNPYTGEELSFSQKVILSAYYDPDIF